MTTTADNLLLDVRNISIRFGGLCAVSKFSCALPKGALHAIIGPNGAGKTTVFNLLTGVYKPSEGDMFLKGARINDLRPHQIARAGMARTFQNIRLFGELSVLDNVKMGAQMRQPHALATTVLRTGGYVAVERQIEATAIEMLEIMGLSERKHAQAKHLPYGDQRRLEIARALATGSQVLLLDEPAAGTNPREKQELMKLIGLVRSRFDVAILLIEHDMNLVMTISEKITVLDHGETIAVGTPQEIQLNPKVIEAYLGEPV